MMLTNPVPEGDPTFAALDRCEDLSNVQADIAILGVAHGIPYPASSPDAPTPATGPAAIREHSARYGRFFHNFDFDLEGPLLGESGLHMVDCGDVDLTEDGGTANHERTAEVIRQLRAQDVVPIVLGGDDSIPIGVMRGLNGEQDVHLVQFDAHLDYRDEVYGIRDGWSSSIRRAAEMSHIGHITQVGLRGAGSASTQDVADARAAGNTFITAREIERGGVEAVQQHLPEGELVYIAFDMDVMDPSIAPGVASTAFGGLSYWQASELLRAVAQRNTIVGANFAEVNLAFDPRALTPTLAARLILNLVAAIARSREDAERA